MDADNGQGMLDLVDDARQGIRVVDYFAHLLDIIVAADKGQGDVVYAQSQAHLQVLDVLGGQRGQVDFGSRQVDALMLFKQAADHDLAFHVLAAGFLDVKHDAAFIKQYLRAFGDRPGQALEIGRYFLVGAGDVVDRDANARAFLKQYALAVAQAPDAQPRAL